MDQSRREIIKACHGISRPILAKRIINETRKCTEALQKSFNIDLSIGDDDSLASFAIESILENYVFKGSTINGAQVTIIVTDKKEMKEKIKNFFNELEEEEDVYALNYATNKLDKLIDTCEGNKKENEGIAKIIGDIIEQLKKRKEGDKNNRD